MCPIYGPLALIVRYSSPFCFRKYQRASRAVLEYCQKLRKAGKYFTIHCSECGKAQQTNVLRRIVAHALSHMTEFMYRCRHCGYDTQTIRQIKSHIERVHNLPKSRQHFSDRSMKYQDEILAKLKECFGKKRTSVRKTSEIL